MLTNIFLKKGVDRFNPPKIVTPAPFLGKNTPPVFGGLTLNPNHFLAQGMVTAWIPGLFGGRDLIGNKHLRTPTGGIFGATYTTGADGRLIQMSSASNLALECNNVPVSDPIVQALLLSGSVYFRGMQAAVPTSYSGYMAVYDVGAAAPIAQLNAAPTAVPGSDFVFKVSNTAANTWTSVFGNTISLGASFGYQSGGLASAYLNGAFDNSVSYGVAQVLTGPVRFTLMETGTQGGTNEGCYCGYIWTRQLSDWEHAYLDANPYCMWMPS